MPPVGFEPTISAGERPQTHALDRATTGTGIFASSSKKLSPCVITQHFVYIPSSLEIETGHKMVLNPTVLLLYLWG